MQLVAKKRHPVGKALNPLAEREDRGMPSVAVVVEEYWALGVKEYWIVDAQAQKVTLLKRGRSDWSEKELHAGDVCETKLLPGFKLPCQAIFDAAAEVGEGE